tara:strand:+ start:2892 stop:5087 length:2196 start_codon:yes stop_codon:yes gene_type:complete
MARQTGNSTPTNSFLKGRITEATGLSFPENAVTDELNCVFKPTGEVVRRLGIDYEDNYASQLITRAGYAMKSYLWKNAGGNGLNNFLVSQVGPSLTFYRVGSTVALSSGIHATQVDITLFIAPGATDVTTSECDFASGKGYLFVTHEFCDPFYISYDPATNAFTTHAISIQIRDFKGVEDNLETTEHPVTLSDEHKYNLYNQGWSIKDTGGTNRPYASGTQWISPAGGLTHGNPIDTWGKNRSDFPSNADVWWILKDAAGQMQPSMAPVFDRGSSPATKGFFKLDAFYQDRAAVSGFGSFPIVSAGKYRPASCAFFGGRVWFSGPAAQDFNNRLYFSSTVKEDTDMGACHQVGDPTSEFDFDLLANDGGTVQILDCGTIYKLVVVFNSLIVFASNGVWGITGSEGIGFTASDYSVSKVSSIPTLSNSSFIFVGGLPVWWNKDGIYTVKPDKLAIGEITSLTEKTIKTFYNQSIPEESKRYASGSFNELTKVAQWTYRSTTATTDKEKYEYDRVLCFDVVSQGFYLWSTPTSTAVYLNGVTAVEGQGFATVTGDVVDSFDAVVVSGTPEVAVTATGYEATEVSSIFKYKLTWESAGNYYLSFADEHDLDYKDYLTIDSVGVYFDSHFTAGFEVKGGASKEFQVPYLTIWHRKKAGTEFNVQTRWNFANTSDTGEFTQNQIVRSLASEDREYFSNRLRIRGQGKALQYKVSSTEGLPFEIIGWAPFETTNTQV